MYSNAGKSIKKITKIIVIIEMIISVIVGIVLMATVEVGTIGLLVAGLGCFFAWVGGLVIYAYGELVDRVISIEAHIVGKKTIEIKQNDRTRENKQDTVTQPDVVNPSVVKNVDGSWNCPFCECHNVPNAQWCENCGIEVTFE